MQFIIDFILLFLIYYLVFYEKWSKSRKDRFVINSLMYLYITLVLAVTLMPFMIIIPGRNTLFLQTVNLIPFVDIIKNHGGATREIILNIIMMMPFGFLLPIIKPRKIFSTVFWSFMFSLCIESMQLMYVWSGAAVTRAFDVTDLITNTLGGLLGYLLYLIFKPLIGKIRERLINN